MVFQVHPLDLVREGHALQSLHPKITSLAQPLCKKAGGTSLGFGFSPGVMMSLGLWDTIVVGSSMAEAGRLRAPFRAMAAVTVPKRRPL